MFEVVRSGLLGVVEEGDWGRDAVGEGRVQGLFVRGIEQVGRVDIGVRGLVSRLGGGGCDWVVGLVLVR